MTARIRVAPAEERTYQNIVFASKREMAEFIKLQALERSGVITDLQRQVPFELTVNRVKVCKYIADFTCRDRMGKLQVFDAKGYATEVFKLKRKLFHACFPDLRIVEL